MTDANGNFSVTVGVDAANTGLVTDTNPLPDLFPIYNVGSSGVLSPLPGTDSGYYVAQAIAQDQSGNQSTPNAARVPFVVDDTAPTAQFVSPTSGQVLTSLTNGGVQFSIITDKNIDLTHFTAASVSGHQRRPGRHPGRRRRREHPHQPQLDLRHLPRRGDRRQGRRADHRSRPRGR